MGLSVWACRIGGGDMKKFLVLGWLWALWGWLPTAYANETPTVVEEAAVNDAPSVVRKFEAVVNALNPGFDELYSVRDGEFKEAVSASLWNYKSNGYGLASLRLGYAHRDELLYSSVKLDLLGLSHRFIPATVRGVATTGYLDFVWKAVGKYGCAGPFVGRNFREDAWDYGATVGGCVTF